MAEWQLRNDNARAADQRALDNRLDDLKADNDRLMDMLSASDTNFLLYTIHEFVVLDARVNDIIPIMICLQRRLDEQLDDNDREREFFLHTLEYLTASHGSDVVAENWMVTSYEVEFGPRIGVGGLYVCSRAWLCAVSSLIHTL